MDKYKELMDKISMREEAKKEARGIYGKMFSEQKRGDSMRRKIIRPVGAAAACLAILIAANAALQHYDRKNIQGEQTSDVVKTTGAVIQEKIADQVKNAFSIKVSAAELSKEKAVPLISEEKDIQDAGEASVVDVDKIASGHALSGDGKTVDYSINVPISCEGNNIEKITYKINKGTFQLVGAKGESPVLSGKKKTGNLNFPINASEDHDQIWYYEEFTIAYDKQPGKIYDLNICGRGKDNGNIFQQHSLKTLKKGEDDLFGDTLITCTVQFKDGTEQTANIKVGTEILKDCEVYPDEEKFKRSDMENHKSVFITYQLQ